VSRRRARGSPVDGVLLLDKPRGISSQTAVSRVKALFDAGKAGHTGTLDPLAEGLLPVCMGEATKYSQGLLDADKGYRAVVRLGITTATGDLEGEVLQHRACGVSLEEVRAVLGRFRGSILQTPPMYSAIKRDGRPLYAYARAGVAVEREARRVEIRSLEVAGMEGIDVTLEVACSKGTYVRVLAEDIGQALGCGACLARLTRVSVGPFRLEEGVGFAALEGMSPDERARTLLPVDALVESLPRVDLTGDEAVKLRAGIVLPGRTAPMSGVCRAYGPSARFLGLVTCEPGGRVVPLRLVSSAPGKPANGGKA
jgi:tRNA pseudouridine55 synthase